MTNMGCGAMASTVHAGVAWMNSTAVATPTTGTAASNLRNLWNLQNFHSKCFLHAVSV